MPFSLGYLAVYPATAYYPAYATPASLHVNVLDYFPFARHYSENALFS